MSGPTKVDLVCRVWYPFFQKQTNNGWKAGRKTQMHELKIHLTLKINKGGRSAHTIKLILLGPIKRYKLMIIILYS